MQRRFVVLERDDDIRALYRRKLEQKFEGCIVEEAASCSDAVATLQGESVDAIIVNEAAIDARGVEMIKRVRAVAPTVRLVSIATAASSTEVLRYGADVFINANAWEQLGEKVEQVLNQPRQVRQA